ncbi:plasminogen receptor (KT)-like [Strongylocentrotus purpuratus]|uniref:Plasminogen receptor (KT) n=1 Tax=Strongylocentrotus purpuratus TaxID=7668 RepID=A0A7M7NHA0_STRPU|nr:plasminogen receptor (KT)-like [Strongylocentrotus purpuratus]XP_030836443.1 plasminogen receptor (KT)-like [Strongylocentrotus purpuratus]XP_030852420.1 plasminogen receptor (KT)-like [Strongylocentrotus purpuratus]XP_030852421.1 plasminogen receptor (KT)-like [Strongylocentrotus purpuratus]
MGSMMAKAMDQSFQKNKEFMTEMQVTTVQRQIQMQNKMRQRGMAMQLAGSRELFNWLASFYGVVAVAGLAGAAKGNKAALVPLIPLTFLVGYQWDYCFNTKVERIRKEAERILNEEPSILALPCGLPTFEDIEASRAQASKQE